MLQRVGSMLPCSKSSQKRLAHAIGASGALDPSSPVASAASPSEVVVSWNPRSPSPASEPSPASFSPASFMTIDTSDGFVPSPLASGAGDEDREQPPPSTTAK